MPQVKTFIKVKIEKLWISTYTAGAMRTEVLYDPIIYPFWQKNKFPNISVPEHRMQWMGKTQSVRRYVFKGYPTIIIDNLEGHIQRVTKRASVLERLPIDDRKRIIDFLQIHDVGEIGKDSDLTRVDQALDPISASKVEIEEGEIAKKHLSKDDFRLWTAYEVNKRFLTDSNLDNRVDVIPEAIMAKIIDTTDNETVFHHWFLKILDEYGERAFQFFPETTFNITFPTLRRYRKNIDLLNLNNTYTETAKELFAQIEKMGILAKQNIL